MFSGESESQARRRTLSVLLDESRKVLEASRELSSVFEAVVKNDPKSIESSINKIGEAEDEVEGYRRALTRELAEVGSLLMNREDLLKTAYEIEEIAGYTSGVAFRLSIVDNKSVKKAAIQKEFEELLKATLDLVYRLNEMVRSLSINPSSVIDIAIELQKIERQTDLRYRNLVKMVIKDITSPKEAMLLKDAAEHIEEMADRCLSAADSITIIAIGL
jgi:predicted phosphate transport protein (TIGR00153 family)